MRKKCPQCHKKTLTKSKFEAGKYACSNCHDWFTEQEVDGNLIHNK